ncbi:MAG: PAS domain S-box protein [Alphaproteobacteria bacterium]|nr:PAS domain S-box protein [Alphaproteobacteria bacterium]
MTKIDEEQLQIHRDLILQASGDGVYGLDCEGRTIFVNPAAERLTGYSSKEMVGKPQHMLIHHSHADGSEYPRLECPIYAAFTDGEVHQVTDEIFWRKDGSSFPVEYVSTPILDEGKIVGAVVSFRDITERKRAEDALLESEERYRKIVEATHEAIFLVRVDDGQMLDVNDEACKMLGFTRDVLMTKTAEDLHPHEMDVHQEVMESLLEAGKIKTDRLSCMASNGEQIPVRVSASIIQLKGTECILFIAQDMREYVQAEKQARKFQSDLHHVSRVSAMGEMASGMAHELNQPLTAVMNYVQACRRILDMGNDEQREKVSDYMEKAVAQAERAGKIISGLRKYVEKSEANRSFEELNVIVEEASKLALVDGAAEGVDFNIDLAEDLPSLNVDKIQIQQVVFNLVRNAIEALEPTPLKQITITTSRAENLVSVSVCDNGPGLDGKLVGKLFDSFVTTKPNGMGLGLSICQSIIEDHGGRICANRNADGGMTFKFTLPISAGDKKNYG